MRTRKAPPGGTHDRGLLRLAGLLLLTAAGVTAGCGDRPAGEPPGARHVIFISLDTTRADYLGCYGASEVSTPRIDRLAREGILLADYSTVVNTTLASHVSLFTGRYPHTHGTPRNGFMVNEVNVMLPEVLGEHGFHTAAFLASFALDSRFGFDQGFDHFDEDFDILVGDRGADQNQRRAEAVTDAVIDYLNARKRDRRLFLFVHYFDPHAPYDAPAPYGGMYDTSAPPPAGGEEAPESRSADLVRRRYAGEISYMDSQVGRLIDFLHEAGYLEDSLLVLTGDHGENLGEHWGHFDHGHAVYQTTMAAPAIIRLPDGGFAGTVVRGPLSSIDIMPTVLAFLEMDIPAPVEGAVIDLRHAVDQGGRRAVFGEATKPWREVETDPRWYNIRKARFVREGSLKYMEVPYRNLAELYDLAADPREETNLLGAADPRSAALRAGLKEQLDRWTASADPEPSRFEPSQIEETKRRLKALGYLK